jgi:hypothetical protein
MPSRPWKFVAGGLLLACPFSAGCVGGYVYPSPIYIPQTRLEKPAAATVHAFRVEILDTSGTIEFTDEDQYRFSEVPVTEKGVVPAQKSVRFARGWWALVGTHQYSQSLQPTIRLRLYRPGYETVEFGPWARTSKLKWNLATTLAAREAAIDDLISTHGTNELYKIAPEVWQNERVDYALAAPTTDIQRAALLFVAGEYDRLVPDAVERGDTRTKERLQEKARQLRALALQ